MDANLKLIIQGILSLTVLVGGFYITLAIPTLQVFGGGLIGTVLGYWFS